MPPPRSLAVYCPQALYHVFIRGGYISSYALYIVCVASTLHWHMRRHFTSLWMQVPPLLPPFLRVPLASSPTLFILFPVAKRSLCVRLGAL